MSLPKIVGLGCGGHARVVVEALRLAGGGELVGWLDARAELRGTTVCNATVWGGDELLMEMPKRGVTHFFVGVGSVGDTKGRRRLFESGIVCGLNPLSVVHPSVIVSPSAALGAGVTVLAGAIINAHAKLGDNVLVNTGAIVEHDCMIENHVHVATGARLGGGVRVGEGSHIGIGATVKQGVEIGSSVIVGAGAVVVKKVANGLTVVGVPARELQSSSASKNNL